MRVAEMIDVIQAGLAGGKVATDDDGGAFTGIVTPDRWRGRCARHRYGSGVMEMCGHCYFCRQEVAIECAQNALPWTEGGRMPHREHEHIFPNVAAALAALVRSWDVQRGTPSPTGPQLDRVRLGLHSGEQSYRPFTGAAEHLQIEELNEVRRAFDRAYDSHFDGGAVGEHTARAILVTALVGKPVPLGEPPKLGRPRAPWAREWGRHPMKRTEIADELTMPVKQVSRVIRHGRQSMVVDLAAAGVIPMPRPSEGLHERIEREMQRRRVRVCFGASRRMG